MEGEEWENLRRLYFICRSYFDSVEGEEQDCGRMKDDFGCLVLIFILRKGGAGEIKDDIGCRVYFDSVERRSWTVEG